MTWTVYGRLFTQGEREIANKELDILGHLETENNPQDKCEDWPHILYFIFQGALNLKVNQVVRSLLAVGYISIVLGESIVYWDARHISC